MLININDEDLAVLQGMTGFSEAESANYAVRLAINILKAANSTNDMLALDNTLNLHNEKLFSKIALLEQKIAATSIDTTQQVLATLSPDNVNSPFHMLSPKYKSRNAYDAGRDFETGVGAFIGEMCLDNGDHVESIGSQIGLKANAKVGDYLLTMHTGDRIVIETKRDRSYNVKKILDECRRARENRDAKVAIFILYKDYGMTRQFQPITIYEQDIVVLWDEHDETTFNYLKSAIVAAKAITTLLKEKQRDSQDAYTLETVLDSLKTSIEAFHAIELRSSDIMKFATDIKSQATLQIQNFHNNVNLLQALIR